MARSRKWLAGSTLGAAILMMFPCQAHADAGIAMMPVRYPLILVYLLPVIGIEAFYLKSQLGGRWRRTLVASAGVNIITMGMGYPLAWFIYMALNWGFHFPTGMDEVFTRVGSWLPMYLSATLLPNAMQQSALPVLGLWVVLQTPGFFLSGMMKVWLVDWYDLLSRNTSSKSAIWDANRLSYLFLIVAGCVVLYLILQTAPGA
jgi:hypothetical protein